MSPVIILTIAFVLLTQNAWVEESEIRFNMNGNAASFAGESVSSSIRLTFDSVFFQPDLKNPFR